MDLVHPSREMKLKLRRVLCSKDVVLELPVAIFHTATLPPPPPEPYPYPTPGAYSTMDPIPLVLSAALLLHSPMPILYPEPTQSPIYTYHSPALLLPSSPAPGQLVIPSYTPHNGQLWFPPPPNFLRTSTAIRYITNRHSAQKIPIPIPTSITSITWNRLL